ncbi:MAG: hypothetical protein J5U19_11915 [Candidatus Methanoperedens sp.]|nr:hypothetical protein [Candidatus Methanoperedens sp.]
MNLRKSISLDEEYLKKIEPLVQKHNGNLSAVIREIIDLADYAYKDPDSVKRLISGMRNKQSLTSSTLAWALKDLAGRRPDREFVNNIIGKDIYSITYLEKRLNELLGEVYWDSSVKITSDDDRAPQNASFIITGKNQDMNRFIGAFIAVFVSEKYDFGISNTRSENNFFEMHMVRGSREWALKSTNDQFGYMEPAFSEFYKRPDFWNMVLSLYSKMNYDIVVIPKQFFEEILGGKSSHKITTVIEKFYGCPINQIPVEDLLKRIKDVYLCTGLIENADIDKESLILYHSFTEPESIKKLALMFVELLRLSGHAYSSVTSRNLIVLNPIPGTAKILVKMIDTMRNSELQFEKYHADILKMLDMLKNMPSNEEIIRSMGWKFGIMIIENYQKYKKVSTWDEETFIAYMKETSSILKMDSTWEIISKNAIYGRIRSFPWVENDTRINNLNRTFIKGMFQGWVSHAFGEETEVVLTMPAKDSGNDFSEIYIDLRLS